MFGLLQVPRVEKRAVCMICKTPGEKIKVLSTSECYKAVTKYFKEDKHQASLTKLKADPDHNLFDTAAKLAEIEGSFEK